MSLIAEPDNSAVDLKAQLARKWKRNYWRKHREDLNAIRRAKNLYVCSCGQTFEGPGRWQTAQRHAQDAKHKLRKNGKRVILQ